MADRDLLEVTTRNSATFHICAADRYAVLTERPAGEPGPAWVTVFRRASELKVGDLLAARGRILRIKPVAFKEPTA